MFYCKGPEKDIVRTLVCPMKGGMNHEGPCHIHDGLNSSFSTGILVMGADTGEGLTLSFFLTVAPKFFSREDTIVTMIMFDFTDTLVKKPLFETSFTHYCFVSTKRNLVLYPNEARCCIIKDGTALITVIL